VSVSIVDHDVLAFHISKVLQALRAQTAPAIVTGDRPLLEQGLQIGDILADRAMIWSRSDRPARMIVK
jgi:alkaline phosphatase D